MPVPDALGLMARVDSTGSVKGELVEWSARVGLDRVEEEGDVVAYGIAGEDGGGEPVVAVVEEGEAVGAFVPVAMGELVYIVAGLAAEDFGQMAGGGRDEVDGYCLCFLGKAGSAVLVREADEEPRRVDAALGGEADQAASERLPLAGGDDEHRVVELADQLLEVLRCLLVLGHADFLPGRPDHQRRLSELRRLFPKGDREVELDPQP